MWKPNLELANDGLRSLKLVSLEGQHRLSLLYRTSRDERIRQVELRSFLNKKITLVFETHIQTGEISRVVVQCGVIVVDESVGDILGRHVRLVQRTLKKVKVGAI